jgi:hypothetical protein
VAFSHSYSAVLRRRMPLGVLKKGYKSVPFFFAATLLLCDLSDHNNYFCLRCVTTFSP